MIQRKLSFSLLLTLGLLFISCESNKKKGAQSNQEVKSVKIKYAKGFDFEEVDVVKKLVIKSPYPDAKEEFEFILEPKDAQKTVDWKLPSFKVPVEKIVVSSTTHIPMLELLGVENSLIGFQNTQYVSSEKTRKRIDAGLIKDLGKEFALNTEVLFDLEPDVVVGFAMTKTNKTYNLIEEMGIPVVLNGDWLEETPLGRAEWIKFFGLLYNKEKEADSIFNHIEKEYLSAIQIAKEAKTQHTILSGAIMRNDVWSLPAGQSFVAQFLEDANLNYLWKDTQGKGSLNLSFESVFEKGEKADFWIAPGYFSSKEQMLDGNKNYLDFKSFQNDQIYTPSTKTGATGGVIYYELAPTRPDLVLKDLIKITNPQLLPDHKLVFFELMK